MIDLDLAESAGQGCSYLANGTGLRQKIAAVPMNRYRHDAKGKAQQRQKYYFLYPDLLHDVNISSVLKASQYGYFKLQPLLLHSPFFIMLI